MTLDVTASWLLGELWRRDWTLQELCDRAGVDSLDLLAALERAQAQAETVVRIRRSQQGMRGRIRRGLHAGTWPHGYRAIRNDRGRVIGAEFDPDELGAVRLVTDLFLCGYGYNQITKQLNASPWRPRRAEIWPVASVRAILYNDTYAGIVNYGELESLSDLYPAIWDPETYRAIVRERERRYRGNNPPATPASGVAFCGRCGWRMQYSARWGEPAYRCRKHATKSVTGQRCHRNYVDADEVLRAIAGTLQQLADPAAAAAMIRTNAPDLSRLEREQEEIRGHIEDLNRRRQRLALALAEGTMLADVYRSADDELAGRLDLALTRGREIAQALISLPDPDELAAAIAEVAARQLADPDWLTSAPVLEARTALQKIGLRVICVDGHVAQVTFNNPD